MGATIGKCRFTGNRPPKCTNYGTLQIYHSSDFKKSGTSGGKNVWSGSGDVWVIYKSKRDVGKQIFKVSGKVQECFEYVK